MTEKIYIGVNDERVEATGEVLEEILQRDAEWRAGEFEREYALVEANRAQAYRETADPLFFQVQRGEATEQEWLDAVQAVKTANPYPKQPKA